MPNNFSTAHPYPIDSPSQGHCVSKAGYYYSVSSTFLFMHITTFPEHISFLYMPKYSSMNKIQAIYPGKKSWDRTMGLVLKEVTVKLI